MTPMMFLMHLREKYPQFAQQTNTGMYMQQDAEECWTQLLYSLRERLKVRRGPCSSTRSLTLASFPDPQRSCLSETRLGESCLSQTAPMVKMHHLNNVPSFGIFNWNWKGRQARASMHGRPREIEHVPACAQDPADADAVQQLFGVGLQSRLVCEESGEAIEEGSTVYDLKWAPSLSLPSNSP